MHHYVYLIKNVQNDKIYVGKHSTENLDDGYMGSGKLITKAIAKYGLENFRKEILKTFTSEEEALEYEQQVVNEEFVARVDTYNLNIGGSSFWSANRSTPNRRAARQKAVAISHQVRWHGENALANRKSAGEVMGRINRERFLRGEFVPLNWTGRRHSVESKKKISEANSKAQVGEKNSQYGTIWIFNTKERMNKKIKHDEFEQWFQLGWIRGRKMKW